ncbi:MAG: response regulator [Saprospiraceae bacterium]|uniref:hybrid sensor histidine kinase/response regulator transcription factor n=1 Tax=Candidatus Brachybacter algidus TaxID=2982024 RepID=UPI00257AD138|nr:two-component regulator propeller domain-containing protein [Candidatus Brachybacter algidus]MBK7604389.1 response regulator [Candidatus Brachybacter algidus]
MSVLILLLSFFTNDTSAQSIKRNFRELTISNGLSQNMVSSILQDHNGYMWFGTKDGLNRFDGYSCKIYKSDLFDSTSISDNHITCLYEDKDNNLWVGSRLGGLNLYVPGADFFIKVIDSRFEGKSIIINSISGNFQDGIWISTLDGQCFGLDISNSKDAKSLKVKFLKVAGLGTPDKSKVLNVYLDQHKLLWIATIKGLQIYNLKNKQLDATGLAFSTTKVFDRNNAIDKIVYSPFRESIYETVEDEVGNIWLAGDAGLYMFDNKKRDFLFYKLGGWVKTISISHNRNGEKEVWAGSFSNGLMILNIVTNKLEVIEYDNFSNLGVLNGLVHKIYKGSDGTVWMGTNGRGVVYFSPNNSLFQNNMPKKLMNFQPSVYSIFPIKSHGDKSIIINTMQYFYHEDLTYGHSKFDTSFFSRITYEDEHGQIWMGSTDGLVTYNPETKKIIPIDSKEEIVYGIYGIGQKIWYTTPNSLKLYNTLDNTIRSFQLLGKEDHSSIVSHESLYSTLKADSDGTLWIGAVNGLYHFDPIKEKFRVVYKNDPKNPKSISSNEIKSILPDPIQPDKTLWVGTTTGLNKLNKATGTFIHYNISDGLPNNTIYGILADTSSNLWLSTNHGLSVFNILKQSFTNFDVHNGLQSNEFNTGAYYKSSDGEMFFGGISGYNRFYPDKINLPLNKIPIVITDVNLPGSKFPYRFSFFHGNLLTHDNNNISITLASLDYASPEKLRYAYRIYNNDTSWIMLGNNRNVTLSNLSPGKYIFQGKGTDAFGRWGENVVEMVFVISPPWWKSLWAYFFYLILLGSLMYYLWNRNKQRLVQKHQLENERREAAAIIELDLAKTKFVDNITHEFRTPLTMILGLTDANNVNEDINPEKVSQKNATIRRNGKQLLNLVDQLLELSKLESGKQTIDLEAGVLSGYLSHLVNSFESLANLSGIKVIHNIDFGEKVFLYDAVKIQQVLSNLISNAIKFSKDGSEIIVHSSLKTTDEKEILTVQVMDEGMGIPEDELKYVFDRFHRVKINETKQLPGTGIGLALAKELVEIMGGTIDVRSEYGKGSVFSFEIPILKSEDKSTNINNEINDQLLTFSPVKSDLVTEQENLIVDPLTEEESDLAVILIVEDNEDVRNYIQSCVSEKFKVITAVNGVDGLNKALEFMPDIIISDVMMPEKDGFTLCDDIKNNPITSHIPVILLTAKVDAKSKIEGLRKGADSYLAKPFDREELLLILDNMISLIRSMQIRHYAIMNSDLPENLRNESTLEDDFINRVLSILESHYANEEFSIEDMADQVFMSRSQLFRKIKAMTSHSPSTFLRSFRLKKAKELLLARPDLNISEVAYSTGFSSPKYFSNVFLEEFGHRPRQ